ncbi:hypothetical protein Pint_34011 [Pistacia integerrima]|uniref:Uncharacterized protein n=1 Tax=Pistacia integerrima TaxID=434235 RepID=A0ACC0X6Z8_9ROSI|nr:hypothetical protein Pint_34011 [Pistacia integerrima]
MNPNPDAMLLWAMLVTCELWFGFSWILDQIPKLCPINCSTDLVALRDKFDMPSPSNPTGRSDLPGFDVFVSMADPEKEPPLAMAEAASFADLWVPFCRKHNIEPRNPESYFAVKVDHTKNKSRSDFVKDRRKIKREYDEFKVRINGLPDSIRRRSDAFNAREEMKMLKHMRESTTDPAKPLKVIEATWMADGTH